MMKSFQVVSHHSKPLLAIASACAFAVSVAGCSMFGGSPAKQPMTASAENTSGEGTVQTKADNNGNIDVEVRVKHLSAPAKVESDASVYVVWLKAHDSAIQNVGALKVDDELVGTFNTTTPHRNFTLSVTPEPSVRMSKPTHEAVFTSDVVVAGS
jgi:hypothetical protein